MSEQDERAPWAKLKLAQARIAELEARGSLPGRFTPLQEAEHARDEFKQVVRVYQAMCDRLRAVLEPFKRYAETSLDPAGVPSEACIAYQPEATHLSGEGLTAGHCRAAAEALADHPAGPSDTDLLEAVITNSWHIGGESYRHQAHDYLNNPVTPGEWFETPREALRAAIAATRDERDSPNSLTEGGAVKEDLTARPAEEAPDA